MDHYFYYSATAQLVIDPIRDRVIKANQETCRLLQQDMKTLCERKASVLFIPSFPLFLVFTEEAMEFGRAWSDRLTLNTSNKDERFEISARSVQIDKQSLLHLSLQRVDDLARMRERSDAERHYLSGVIHWNRVSQVFREFERENQLLLEAAGEGIYGVDANGITTFVNPAAEKILGYSADELAGRNMHSMIHHSHADGAHFSATSCPIFAAFRDGVVHQVEDDTFWSKTGQAIDVEYTSTPIRDRETIVGAVIIFRDVSQKKADKTRLLNALKEVEQLKTRLEMENSYLQEEISDKFNHQHIIGKSSAIQNLLQQIELVGPTDATVLINGESGTGKELIARAIHDASTRAQRSLIKVNCAAVPEDLFESEFFGHVKGSFTGASADRAGRFELADGGTLFLDEVGEIPMHLQGKLLRVLQEQQFERIGDAGNTRNVDVRIIAATNRDLKEHVEKGLFREDLYFRLNVFPIESVALRQRVVDIPLLTQHFLKNASARLNKPTLKISLNELEKLKAYHWPGNVRELENVIERQVILSNSDTIRFDGLTLRNQQSPVLNHKTNTSVATDLELKDQGRRNVLVALEKCSGKIFGKGGAAELLGIKPTTLASRIKRYQINPREFKA